MGFTPQIAVGVWTGNSDNKAMKLADVAKLNALGWRARIPLREGVRRVYAEAVAGFEVAA